MDSHDRRIFECMAMKKGSPLVKKPIVPHPNPARPPLARYYTRSIVNFALRVFYNREEEFYDSANDTLLENARYYRSDRVIRDDRDSFYWHIGEVVRILFRYGRHGDRQKGLLREDAENEMLRLIAEYVCDNCKLRFFEYKTSGTWTVHDSENHHMQRNCALWMQTKVMLLYPEIGDLQCADGHSVSEMRANSREFLRLWMRERGKKSLLSEAASSEYTIHTLKNIYHIFDFADDAEMREMARSVIDLYYATVAQEHFDGCRGGGQCRDYPSFFVDGFTTADLWHYCALGVGVPSVPDTNDYTMLDSGYRCPKPIRELAQDPQERGTYEIVSRPASLIDSFQAENGVGIYQVKQGWGGMVRYSYCTPDYILGTLHFHRGPDRYVNSQNRSQGVHFAGHRDARLILFPMPDLPEGITDPRIRSASNNWFAAQKGSCLITMPMPEEYTYFGGKPMSIWVSTAGELADRLTEKGGWLFTHCGSAYAAMYIHGSYDIQPDCVELSENVLRPMVTGTWINCRSVSDVVILEMGSREIYGSLEAFREAVLKQSLPVEQDGVLVYQSLQNHCFRFGLGKQDIALIDGVDPAAEIPESYKSPFLNGIWGEPEVVFTHQGETIKWNFG